MNANDSQLLLEMILILSVDTVVFHKTPNIQYRYVQSYSYYTLLYSGVVASLTFHLMS